MEKSTNLMKYAWLSLAAAVVTITMKMVAWRITGSVGLLSDAAESLINFVAAIMAIVMLSVAAKPPDHNHHFGHDKAEYFSAAVEGILIFVAAALIIVAAIDRLIHPQPLESVSAGVIISTIAAAINGAVGMILIRVGKRHRSPTLVADGKHLWTDVVTSIGVVAAIILVALTGWTILDPIVALLVGANIIFTGTKLVWESTQGLMDITLPDEENKTLAGVLADFTNDDVSFHGLRTRVAGRNRFAIADMLVPGDWSVQQSHDRFKEVQAAIDSALPGIQVQFHIEPKEDPRAYGHFVTEVPIIVNDKEK
ncbi:MAG: cation diffusion facilitator family transporter [Propionibacteriaceae bacterium]|nr:cation diffusion facilitator family transporter [Propionibacteriaceae bacterium]